MALIIVPEHSMFYAIEHQAAETEQLSVDYQGIRRRAGTRNTGIIFIL